MTEKWDLRPIYDTLCNYDLRFATKELHVPRMWVAEGFDVLLDCMPTIERILAWSKRKGIVIGGYEYFTDAIRKDRDARLAAPAPKPAQAEVDARKAKSIAWARDKGIKCVGIGPAEFRWLAEYEAAHGPVDMVG